MQDKTLSNISIIILSIGLIILYILLHIKYNDIEIHPDYSKEIFSINGKINNIKTQNTYTTIDVEYMTKQKLIAFDNISLTKKCINAIVQKENDNLIIKKIKSC